MIVAQRPCKDTTMKNTAADYLPCPICYVYVLHHDLSRHKCHINTDNLKLDKRKSKLILPDKNTNAYAEKQQFIMEGLRNDVVGRICKSDSLITEMARRMCANHGQDIDQHPYIREKVRRAGTLLLQMRLIDENPNKNLESYLDPGNFNIIISAARKVAGFDSNTNKFANPSLPNKLSALLKELTGIVESNGLIRRDQEAVEKARSLHKLVELNWKEVSVPANRQLDETKFNKPQLLPLAEDISKLSKYLKQEGAQAEEELKKTQSLEAWNTLNKITLAYLIMFNRRRSGEMGKAKITSFLDRGKPGNQALLASSLSPMEQELIDAFKRMEIRGKRGRKVPVLLTKEVENWLETLMQFRSLHIKTENPFLFATKQTLGHLRGHLTLSKVSKDCGAKNPELLRSTKLRKQVATISQLVNLKGNELDILAKFLGHDLAVHREYYRLPEDHIQVAKVSKLLHAAENGQDITGLKLDDINISGDMGKFTNKSD